jgi:hypothetical protein
MTITLLLLFAGVGSGCLGSTPTAPSTSEPVAVAETLQGTLSVNGARTHSFTVDRAGDVTARLTILSDQAAIVGLGLGTWNGTTCAIILANDAATIGSSVAGTAEATGDFCARISDIGLLVTSVDYIIDVSHF